MTILRTSAAGLALALALVLFQATPAAAQGKCGYFSESSPAPWVSVDAGAGISVPIPLSGDMKVDSVAPAFAAGVLLRLPERLSVGLQLYEKKFEEEYSTYIWGRHIDLLARFGVAAAQSLHVQWDLFALAGTSFVTVQYIDASTLTLVEENGKVVPKGAVMRKNVVALSAGLGSRFAYYPIQPLGIFLEAGLLFAYWDALRPEEGPLTVNAVFGLEGHF